MSGPERRPQDPFESSKWTDEEMLAHVATYLAETDCAGTYAGYESWSAEVDGAPSGPSLRAPLGTWRDVKKLALGHENS